jgi:quinol-cytochrome oxidoreductase complex cytochrome b subunit
LWGLCRHSRHSGPTGSIIGVRLSVDARLLVIVLFSIAIRQPFTLPYARETAAREHRDRFIRTNYVITAVWAFAVLVMADLLLLYAPDVPRWIGVGATVLALAGAVSSTGWYPARVRAKSLV